ncbi:MAG: sugar phosphate nucleotidyltransferase [Nanoarchaeota archaeon]
MKVVILAAGKGTRMLPLTETIPKVLVKVKGKPFLYYVLKNLQQAGYTEFCLVVGYKKEKIKSFLEEYGFKAKLVEQKEQLGTGHALLQVKSFCGKENFISIGGDNLCSVKDFKAIAKEDDYIYVAGIHSESPEKYGVLIKDENNNLIEIKEKPKKFVGNLINTALYKFTPKIFEALEQVKESERREYELPDALTLLAKQGKVKVIKIKDYWLDLGCKEDIPKVEAFLKRLGL